MVESDSQGVNTPVGLSYLIEEGILPSQPGRDTFQWQCYTSSREDVRARDELLWTDRCVLWSRSASVQKIYRFEIEDEDVTQAVLTNFPNSTDVCRSRSGTSSHGSQHTPSTGSHEDAAGLDHAKGTSMPRSGTDSVTSTRALVVILRTKGHIYFLEGSHYIVDLPIDVERVFPAPRGIVLQRKPRTLLSTPSTPRKPAAPPTSFRFSQQSSSLLFSQSPSLARSHNRAQPAQRSPLGPGTRPGAVLQDAFAALSPDEKDLAPLYTLTSPLSEFGVISSSVQRQKPRLSSRATTNTIVDFEALDGAEEIIYMSASDELSDQPHRDHGSCILVVTANSDTRVLTIWHAWYVEEQSLAGLIRQRTAHKAAKARRRSSFLSAGLTTGAATPAVRHREGTRESFTTNHVSRLPADSAPAISTATSSRKPTRQEEEDAMASQMDPDYQPTTSQHNARDPRRISSMNSDVRASQSVPNASFGAAAGRRNASFGAANDRKSYGQRRSRGSTPGSVHGLSFGVNDDMMDLDDIAAANSEDYVKDIVSHLRATYERAGASSLFGGIEQDFKCELVLRRLHSLAWDSFDGSNGRPMCTAHIAVLQSRDRDGVKQKLNVYTHDRQRNEVSRLQLSITHHGLYPGSAKSSIVAVPLVTSAQNLGHCTSMIKLFNSGASALLLGGRGTLFPDDDDTIWPIVEPVPPDANASANTSTLWASGVSSPGISHDRMSEGQNSHAYLEARNNLFAEHIDVIANPEALPPRIRLIPHNRWVDQLLQVCRCVLAPQAASKVSGLWTSAYEYLKSHPVMSAKTSMDAEWIALGATALSFAVHLIDDKARATLSLFEANATHDASAAQELHKRHDQDALRLQGPWRNAMRLTAPVIDGSSQSTDHFPLISAGLALRLAQLIPQSSNGNFEMRSEAASKMLLGLHIFSEEQKLCGLQTQHTQLHALAAVIAQLGACLGKLAWTGSHNQYYELAGAGNERWIYLQIASLTPPPRLPFMEEPLAVFQWFEHALRTRSAQRYPTLDSIAELHDGPSLEGAATVEMKQLTPRITALSNVLEASLGLSVNARSLVEHMVHCAITREMLESLPIAIAAPFKEAIANCETRPPTTWPTALLNLVCRNDLDTTSNDPSPLSRKAPKALPSTSRDASTICIATDQLMLNGKTKEASRHAVSQLIFKEDRRLVEATTLMHFNTVQVAECARQPEWTDAHHLEQQRRIMQWVAVRMIALPAGDAMIHFDSQTPLLTDKYHLPGFSNSCLMQPMGNTMTTDRSGLTEEKVNWAYFHAGVSVGLRISRNVTGIDTSWIAFNKPNELTNRHAGLLLALGLGGHLKSLAKWLSFKYLTPKHTMTSVGLLLGLSASYMGTMDGLITRMLSVHITRMLPIGAAELNISPATQTAGLMGIGLLYYNTQHRRMSEIMLSEIEHMELEDPDSGPDPLRDESYRLAAGLALGFINLGRGKDLRGLHGLSLPERLLAVAVGHRPVRAVHVFDRATAGAVIAVALVYMKSGDKAVARKIDIPDTEAQFDHVRPDVLMLRAMAKHLILWDDIEVRGTDGGRPAWIASHVPACFASRLSYSDPLAGRLPLKSSDIPFLNIVTGLAWVLSLRYAGSGNVLARDEILFVLDLLSTLQSNASSYSSAFNYDTKLTKSTVRRCVDVLASSAATVMAGTGDLKTIRYLRRLHGRTDSDTPYGSHLAAHMAIGVLFLGGGTYTLGTSNRAIAALICAFYPLYPTDVHDNHVHLQAFRHFWVLAAEARCLVVEDIDTHYPISMPIVLTLMDGTSKALEAPCLVPDLSSISQIRTNDPGYWCVTLDFVNNSQHLAAFKANQRILVRRRPAAEAHNTIFSATLAALSDSQRSLRATSDMQVWHAIFDMSIFRDLDQADLELVLPPDFSTAVYNNERSAVIDDRLALKNQVSSARADLLWNLKILSAWAENVNGTGSAPLKWIGEEFIGALKADIEERGRRLAVSGR